MCQNFPGILNINRDMVERLQCRLVTACGTGSNPVVSALTNRSFGQPAHDVDGTYIECWLKINLMAVRKPAKISIKIGACDIRKDGILACS